MSTIHLIARFVTFRRELGQLWQAFLSRETPLHLKALILLVPAYLLMPLDVVPDFIPLFGWLDDLVIVPMLVGWIVRMLPQKAPVYTRAPDGGRVIDGTWRRR